LLNCVSICLKIACDSNSLTELAALSSYIAANQLNPLTLAVAIWVQL